MCNGLPLGAELRRQQAMVFQRPVLLRRSVAANIRFVLKLRGRPDSTRVDEILSGEWFHNAVFYPNMFVQLRALFIRVIHPLAVDRTEVRVYPIRLKGAPDEMLQRTLLYSLLINSAASMVGPDDLEAYMRIQAGLQSNGELQEALQDVSLNEEKRAEIAELTNVHPTSGEVLTIAVTNGATANPGPFLVQIDYV